MKHFFTLLFLSFSLLAIAQFPSNSPLPGIFQISAPVSISGDYNSGKQSNWGPIVSETFCAELVWGYVTAGTYDIDTTFVDSFVTTIVVDSTLVFADSTAFVFDSVSMETDTVTVSYSYFDYFNTVLTETFTVIDEIITTQLTAPSDSSLCTPSANDYTDKIVMIRRGGPGGGCNFSVKVFNAQEAGAIGVVIVNHYDVPTENADYIIDPMGIGTSTETFTIPAVFLSRASSELINGQLQAGNAVEACFYVPSFFEDNGPFAYATPLEEAQTLTFTSAKYVNKTNSPEDLEMTVTITKPDGTTSVASQSFVCPADSSFIMNMSPANSFTPDAIGTYNMQFTNDKTSDILNREFIITEDLFSQDELNIDFSTAVSAADFEDGGYSFDVGNYYITDIAENPSATRKATHITFAVNNLKAFHDRSFSLILYNTDPDNSGLIETFAYGSFEVLGFADYVVDSLTSPNQTAITVELDEPVTLSDTSIYLVAVQYTGSAADSVLVPQYSASGKHQMRTISSMVRAGSGGMLSSGWTTNELNVARLTLAYVTSTNDNALATSQVSVFPNPTSDKLHLDIKLNELSPVVDVQIATADGKVIKTQQFQNIQNGILEIAVNDLTAGTYFATIVTSEGYRSKMFTIVR